MRLQSSKQHVLFCATCRDRLVELRRVEQMAKAARPRRRNLADVIFFWRRKTSSLTDAGATGSASDRFAQPLKIGPTAPAAASSPVASTPAADKSWSSRFGSVQQEPAAAKMRRERKLTIGRSGMLMGGIALAAAVAVIVAAVNFGWVSRGSGPDGPQGGGIPTTSPGGGGPSGGGLLSNPVVVSTQLSLEDPIGTTHTTSPLLRWTAIDGCTYRVTVALDDPGLNGGVPPTIKTNTTDNELQLGTRALRNKHSYLWTVTALNANGTVASASEILKVDAPSEP